MDCISNFNTMYCICSYDTIHYNAIQQEELQRMPDRICNFKNIRDVAHFLRQSLFLGFVSLVVVVEYVTSL